MSGEKIDKESELLKYSEKLVEIQKDGEEHSYKEFFEILDKIKKLIDPNFTAIPPDLKKSIGMATVTAVAAPDPEQRVDICRAGLTLLRTAVILAGGPQKKEYLDKILDHEKAISAELKRISPDPESEHVTLFDVVWRATSFLVLMSFTGYGEINSAGFSWDGGK
ncbi:MAG: hypothetical protein WCX79_01040 [Candidatus Paceibacterota bacterium]|jgi:hypothetical protein